MDGWTGGWRGSSAPACALCCCPGRYCCAPLLISPPPPLPAHTDDMLEALEPSSEPAEFAGGSGGLSQEDGIAAGGGDGASAAAAPDLSALLAAAAEASGALAAVDAVQYVSGLALAQAQQLRQQHCAELAAFQWANEHQLGPEAAAAAEALLQGGGVLSAAAMAAAGASLPRLHPAVAGWTVRSGRHGVLAELRAGLGALLSLEAPLAAWQQQLVAAGQELSAEVAAVAPWAAADLEQRLRGQQAWLQATSAHAANLQEVAQAVLQLEAARAAGTPDTAASAEAAAAAPGEQQAQARHAADRYAAAQQEGWRRYAGLVGQMQALHARHVAADRAVAAAASELAQLQLRRREATTIAQSAEAAGSHAATTFAAAALPLVKATQQLPPAVTRLLPQLAGADGWAEQLRQAQQQTAELAASVAGEAGGATQGAAAAAAAQQLAAAAACVAELPAAVQALQAALLPARNRLLAGGRGEAAARQQTAQTIDALSPSITQLGPQVRGSQQAGMCMRLLAARLGMPPEGTLCAPNHAASSPASCRSWTIWQPCSRRWRRCRAASRRWRSKRPARQWPCRRGTGSACKACSSCWACRWAHRRHRRRLRVLTEAP